MAVLDTQNFNARKLHRMQQPILVARTRHRPGVQLLIKELNCQLRKRNDTYNAKALKASCVDKRSDVSKDSHVAFINRVISVCLDLTCSTRPGSMHGVLF